MVRARLSIGVQPLYEHWGNRGRPIHRRYLEQFLQDFSSDIRGHCVEFQEDSYTSRFGGERVTKVDILHRDEGNPRATIVADLTKGNDIPSNSFDCIVCTQVLHIIPELEEMIAQLYRILKPHGVLLVSVPHIAPCYPQYQELWRFTSEGLHLLLAKRFGAANVTVRPYGNSLTAVGDLRGLVAKDFTATELNYHDPRFALVVCARAVKHSEMARR